MAQRDDLTVALELMMYFGRDVNLIQVFDAFREVHKKNDDFMERFADDMDDTRFDEVMRTNFNNTVSELKYMGFISATRTSTFLFKKNVFSKPKYYTTEGE